MVLQRIKEEQKVLRREIREKTVGYILAAFGLVAALAWNEAIKAFIDIFFPTPGNDVMLKFVYAFIVTLLVVLASIYLLKNQDKK